MKIKKVVDSILSNSLNGAVCVTKNGWFRRGKGVMHAGVDVSVQHSTGIIADTRGLSETY
jgi:hypothetical protein